MVSCSASKTTNWAGYLHKRSTAQAKRGLEIHIFVFIVEEHQFGWDCKDLTPQYIHSRMDGVQLRP